MHRKNVEVFYIMKKQILNKLFKIKPSLQKSPQHFVCCLDDLEVCIHLSFMWVVCAECAKHLLSLL